MLAATFWHWFMYRKYNNNERREQKNKNKNVSITPLHVLLPPQPCRQTKQSQCQSCVVKEQQKLRKERGRTGRKGCKGVRAGKSEGSTWNHEANKADHSALNANLPSTSSILQTPLARAPPSELDAFWRTWTFRPTTFWMIL